MGVTEERLGEIRKNNFGTEMKIIEYKNADNIVVKFLDDYGYEKRTTYSNFKTGGIKNPYDKTVYGKGYIGEGKYVGWVNGNHTEEYEIWKGILKRCYSESQKDVFNSYFNISEVCDEWLNFQNFAEWYHTHKYECDGRLHIDKDIKYPGNKLYSPYHCLLTPQRINILFMNKPNNRGLPNGIKKYKSGYLAKYNQEELGIYPTVEEAYEVYASEKEKTIKRFAEEYKEIIPKKVYDSLYAYKVDIRNDKNYVA